MNAQFTTKTLGTIAFAAAMFLISGTTAQAYDAAYSPSDGMEVLTSGALHEAYAEPTQLNPADGVVTFKAPPEAIEEIPPAEKPEGDVLWIPGYWSWDVERDDYIWISGVWRVAPYGRSWVPGYWSRVNGGWSWVSGFWMAEETKSVTYLQRPPATLELGASSPAPSPNHLWTPGSWIWTGGGYAWRPGYWVMASPTWVWQPSVYTWTPAGYVFVDGYWDYAFDNRGVVFAPVYYTAPVYVSVGYVYRPRIVIQASLLSVNLFFSTSSCHFYFGNYYGPACYGWGYRPWWYAHGYCYQPIYVHIRWDRCKKDKHWDRDRRNDYDRKERDKDSRPPKTYQEQIAMANKPAVHPEDNVQLAAPIEKATPPRFVTEDSDAVVPPSGRSDRQVAEEVNQYANDRATWEGNGKGTSDTVTNGFTNTSGGRLTTASDSESDTRGVPSRTTSGNTGRLTTTEETTRPTTGRTTTGNTGRITSEETTRPTGNTGRTTTFEQTTRDTGSTGRTTTERNQPTVTNTRPPSGSTTGRVTSTGRATENTQPTSVNTRGTSGRTTTIERTQPSSTINTRPTSTNGVGSGRVITNREVPRQVDIPTSPVRGTTSSRPPAQPPAPTPNVRTSPREQSVRQAAPAPVVQPDAGASANKGGSSRTSK